MSFPSMAINGVKKLNYSGFDRENWPRRNNENHMANVKAITSASNVSTRERLEKQYGCRYSSLLELEYYNPIVHHVVYPMHNLFLGTAKKMFKLWLDSKLLRFSSLLMIENKIATLPIPSNLGRIPTTISSNFGTFTAAEWKNWTLVYSLYSLSGLLPKDHLVCWQTFVLACQILCHPFLFLNDIHKADLLLIKFCKTVESLYGTGVVTPNMHMHGHLVECIREYGPMASFWLFSFERYNGLLGKFSNNKRRIEVQLMRKFLAISHSCNSVISEVYSNLREDLDPLLNLQSGNDNENEAKSHCEVSLDTFKAYSAPVTDIMWHNVVASADVELPKRSILV